MTTEAQVLAPDVDPSTAPQTLKTPKTAKAAPKRAPKRSTKAVAVAASEQASVQDAVVLKETPVKARKGRKERNSRAAPEALASTVESSSEDAATVLPQAKKRSRFARLMDYCFRRRSAKKRDVQRNASPVVEAVTPQAAQSEAVPA